MKEIADRIESVIARVNLANDKLDSLAVKLAVVEDIVKSCPKLAQVESAPLVTDPLQDTPNAPTPEDVAVTPPLETAE